MTFYSVVDLSELVRLHKEGMGPGFSLTPSFEESEDRAWYEEQVIISVEIDDPDAALGADTEAIDRIAEDLLNESRAATSEEEETGLFSDITGEPLTWDAPFHLEQAAMLTKFSDEGLTWQESVEYFGSAELLRDIPAERLLLTRPIDLTEIEDQEGGKRGKRVRYARQSGAKRSTALLGASQPSMSRIAVQS